MSRVLRVELPGDGTAIIDVDVAVDVIEQVAMPVAAYLMFGAEAVAESVARRYARRTMTLRGDRP